MKVLMVLHSHQCGGAENHALLLMQGLLKRGVRVAYCGPRDSWLAQRAQAASIPFYQMAMHGSFDLLSLMQLLWAARNFGATCLHGHLGRGAHYAGWAGWLLGLPVIATAHATNVHKHFTKAAKIIAVSFAVQSYLLEQGYAAERIEMIHNAVADPHGVQDRARLRRELEIPDYHIAVGLVARFVRDKGQDLAVEALRRLHHPQVHLYLAGDTQGNWFQQIEQQVADAKLQDRVHFLGHREDIPQVLAAMDLLIAPSRREAFGLSILEAAATPLPILATRVGGHGEILTDRVDGILVPANDAESLSKALLELVEDADLRNSLADRARLRFLTGFGMEQWIESTCQAYTSVSRAS